MAYEMEIRMLNGHHRSLLESSFQKKEKLRPFKILISIRINISSRVVSETGCTVEDTSGVEIVRCCNTLACTATCVILQRNSQPSTGFWEMPLLSKTYEE